MLGLGVEIENAYVDILCLVHHRKYNSLFDSTFVPFDP